MKSRKFTLIELLIVVAIIGILMGILLPVLGTVKTKGKEVKAKSDMNSIVAGCKQYESDYGVLPYCGTSSSGSMSESESTLCGNLVSVAAASASTEYQMLMQLLTGATYPTSSSGGSMSSTPWNVRGIKYLEVPSSYSQKLASLGGYVDPWGYTYGIALDIGNDSNAFNGQINVIYPKSSSTYTTVMGSVGVYSRGSNPAATSPASSELSAGTADSSHGTPKYLLSWK